MSESGTTIRTAGTNDLPALFAYLDDHLSDNGCADTALFQPMARAESTFPYMKQDGVRTGLATPLDQPDWRRFWIAVDGYDNIVGHVDLRARPERASAHRALLGMGVHRGARRQGLGMRLIGTALTWARETRALDWIDLEVLSANAPARALYRSAEFVVTGEASDMFRIDGDQLGYTYMTIALRSGGSGNPTSQAIS